MSSHIKRKSTNTKDETDDKRQRTTISEDDYYIRSNEFRLWLAEKRDTFLDELSSKEARSYFKKFIKRWNKGDLDKKFYTGEVHLRHDDSTRYKWKFANKLEAHELDLISSVTDKVNSLTKKGTTGIQGPKEVSQQSRVTNYVGPSVLLNKNENGDEEDYRRYQGALIRKDRNEFHKTKDMVMEELVPKETGRAAILEKRREARSFHQHEKNLDIEIKDTDLFGGGGNDDFKARVRARDQAQAKRDARRDQKKGTTPNTMTGRLHEYRAKEDATMLMFTQMAAKYHNP